MRTTTKQNTPRQKTTERRLFIDLISSIDTVVFR
jgi:hypothetical protein